MELREGIGSIQALLGQLTDRPSSPLPPAVAPEDIEQRLETAINASQFTNDSTFALVAVPPQQLNLRQIFESRNAPLVQHLENPPTIRRSGFDLVAGQNSSLHEGRLRRVVTAEYKLLELHRDGVLVFLTSGDHLCRRGNNPQRQFPRINPVVLVETTYLFVLFLHSALDGHIETGAAVQLQLELRGFETGPKALRLYPGALDSPYGPATAPAGTYRGSVEIRFQQTTPERAAVLLIAELYSWFGLEEDRIPYTRESDEGLVVDPDQIASLR
ncbi:MAG TPA: hypothetical protein VEW48_08625 [Thermoanaerobaculia bacterium]|nr:hypothetical protein [Thermoanaerobaculia bacterium]